jgi:maltose alpha-D-glucosyltransferase/alpha-amylase
MEARWFQNAVIYCLDVDTFRDGNGDGIGDFIGLEQSLSYLAGLGVTCIWLLPFYPSPDRDNGYDIIDYLGVHPALGDLGDFASFMAAAETRGLRVIVDLVVNHTSDQHPWFKAARAGDPKYRNYYLWREDEPGDTSGEVVFPGKQKGVWTRDDQSGIYYFHRFYSHQPDLNTANPEVRDEIKKIIRFWLRQGVAGFRIDAAPFVIAHEGTEESGEPYEAFEYLTDFRDFLSWHRGNAVFMAEANVLPSELPKYFGKNGERMNMVLNFWVNPHLFLALADQSPEPLIRALNSLVPIPGNCQWGSFLRNHDELDLSRLTELERRRCFAAFGPRPEMQLYNRGIRRRLAPMLKRDRERLLLAYALMFTLPGAPVLWYGEEIGMGEDLSLEERNSIRTPMQWNDAANGGFSSAPKDKLRRPVISSGPFRFKEVNVQNQRRDPVSLLNSIERMIRVRKEYPEVGVGQHQILSTNRPEHVFARSSQAVSGELFLACFNLGTKPVTAQLRLPSNEFGEAITILGGEERLRAAGGSLTVELGPSGFRWMRVRRR